MDKKLSLYNQLEHIKQQSSVCTDCQLSNTRSNVVFGSGDVEAKFAVVGEGPSAADNHTGFPFSGPAGNMLDEVLVANGLTRSAIWLTNIIKCRAVSLKGPKQKNRLPKASEIKACSKWLHHELTLIQPIVILCLGATAAKVIIHQRFRITEERGTWFTDSFYAPWTMATYNPAYILRQEGDSYSTMRQTVIDDIGNAVQRLNEPIEHSRTTLF